MGRSTSLDDVVRSPLPAPSSTGRTEVIALFDSLVQLRIDAAHAEADIRQRLLGELGLDDCLFVPPSPSVQWRVLLLLEVSPYVLWRRGEIAAIVGSSGNAVGVALHRLVQLGLVGCPSRGLYGVYVDGRLNADRPVALTKDRRGAIRRSQRPAIDGALDSNAREGDGGAITDA